MSLSRATISLLLAAHLVSGAFAAEAWTTIRACLPNDSRSTVWNGREYVGIGRQGVVFSSPDGVLWTSQGIGPKVPVNRLLLRDGEYLAVGDSGIHRSVDLATWTRVHASVGALWGISAWSDTVVAVGDSGQILRRIGSGSWVAMVSGTRNRLYFASKALGEYYVGGDDWLAVSRDGAGWIPKTTTLTDIYALDVVGNSLVVATLTGVYFSRDRGGRWAPVAGSWVGIPTRIVRAGNLFVVPTTGGSICVLKGDSASTEVATPLGDIQDVVIGGPNAVAVGRDGRMGYASDLTDWKTEYRSQSLISHAADKWFVASSKHILYSSTNGRDWKADSTPTRIIRKVVESPQGFLAIGKLGTPRDNEPARHIFSSTDGVTWNNNFSVKVGELRGIARFGSRIFVVGSEGTALQSTDGTSWDSIPISDSIDIKNILVVHDRIFLCGDSTYTSTDGKNWSLSKGPFTANESYFGSMVHTGTEFVATAKGILYFSKDGIAWTRENNGTTWKWSFLTWNGKEIVALTEYGRRFATSPDGITWTASPDTLPEPMVDLAVDGDRALAIGSRGTLVALGNFPTTSTRARPLPTPYKTERHSIDGRTLPSKPKRRLGAPRY
jgi:hypothetical protein